MRILIVSNTYAPHLNGQAVFTTNLAEGLAADQHQVMVLTPGIDRVERENRNGVIVVGTPALDLRFIHEDFVFAWRYQKLVRTVFKEFDPEVIHLQDSAPLSQAILQIAKKHGIPVNVTHHTGPAVWAPYFSGKSKLVQKVLVPIIWKWLMNYLNQADMVSVPSRASARMLLAKGLKVPVRSISCGVQLDRFTNAAQIDRNEIRQKYQLPFNKKLLLYVGRLDEEKRVNVLLEGFSQIKDYRSVLVLAGDGSKSEELHELADDLNIQGRVIFLGSIQRNELPALYAACDIFVMPGDAESLSIATLEAMASGKPVIAANAMALTELVNSGENGLLFKPGDAIDLGTQLENLLSRESEWAKMGEVSRESVQVHSLSQTILNYENFYNKELKTIRKTPQLRIPGSLMNPYVWFVIAQWAIALSILIISLITQNRPVLAAPDSMEILGPQVIKNIQHIFTMLKEFELPGYQANGGVMLSANLKILLQQIIH